MTHTHRRTLRCECEHEKHFPQQSIDPATEHLRFTLEGHAYGVDFAERHIRALKTKMGVFDLCPACWATCHADSADDGENHRASLHEYLRGR